MTSPVIFVRCLYRIQRISALTFEFCKNDGTEACHRIQPEIVHSQMAEWLQIGTVRMIPLYIAYIQLYIVNSYTVYVSMDDTYSRKHDPRKQSNLHDDYNHLNTIVN
jgi:hypothetical protein